MQATVRAGVASRFVVMAMTAVAWRAAPAQRMEALWYATGSAQSTQAFVAHADRISIVSPQVFFFDSLGGISGTIDSALVAAAREQHVQIVPLVMNRGFNQALMHRILVTPDARDRAVESLAALCRDNHFDGIQFDIENVHVSDRDALTDFMRRSATALHAVRCTVSAAVVPRATDDRGPTSYHQWMYDNWRGVYDYKALADALDFISYMTYAQHTGGSTVGPVAGYPWMEDCLRFVLSQGVPPDKISLGIPAYSDYWYPAYDTTSGARMRGSDVSYARVTELVSRFGLTPVWDDREKAATAAWSDAGVYEHLWIEDARAFAAKVELVRKYKLRGYSVWVLGLEDPAVWR